jgi:hypothetical protein
MNTDDISNISQIVLDKEEIKLANQEQTNQEQIQKLQELRINRIQTEVVNMVCRQTDYDENTARDKLKNADYNYEIVLNEFYGISSKKSDSTHSNNTTNQQIYGEIRNLMDIGARKFRTDQENAEKYKNTMEEVD